MGDDPKKKLIESGSRVFAMKGYFHSKVAEIATDANANIASINYHFNSKENLFIETLKHAFEVGNQKYPVTSNLNDNAPPLERVRFFAQAILRRSFDKGPAGDFNRMMCNTIHTPHSPIERIMLEVCSFELDELDRTLRELYEGSPLSTIQLAKTNLISLATIISKYPFLMTNLVGETPSEEQISLFIEIQLDSIVASLQVLAQNQLSE